MKLHKASLIILICLMLFCAHPSAATCSCDGGASSSYNFLGDSSFDVDMMSYEDFSRDYYLANKPENSATASSALNGAALALSKGAEAKDEPNGAGSISISLDLEEGSHIDAVLFNAGKDLFGSAQMAKDDASAVESMGAIGAKDDENRLILELVSLKGELYRFDLKSGGKAVLGDYAKVMPDGTAKKGTAIGTQEVENKEI